MLIYMYMVKYRSSIEMGLHHELYDLFSEQKTNQSSNVQSTTSLPQIMKYMCDEWRQVSHGLIIQS